MPNNNISQEITVFHGRIAPEEGLLVGFKALTATEIKTIEETFTKIFTT